MRLHLTSHVGAHLFFEAFDTYDVGIFLLVCELCGIHDNFLTPFGRTLLSFHDFPPLSGLPEVQLEAFFRWLMAQNDLSLDWEHLLEVIVPTGHEALLDLVLAAESFHLSKMNVHHLLQRVRAPYAPLVAKILLDPRTPKLDPVNQDFTPSVAGLALMKELGLVGRSWKPHRTPIALEDEVEGERFDDSFDINFEPILRFSSSQI